MLIMLQDMALYQISAILPSPILPLPSGGAANACLMAEVLAVIVGVKRTIQARMLKMKRSVIACFAVMFSLAAAAQAAVPNVLVVASTRPYSSQHGVRPMDEPSIIKLVKQRLASDMGIKGNINVVLEDVYRTKQLETATGGSGGIGQNTYKCHSLAQWYFWPEGREERMANLKGQGATKWDAVVLMGDASLLANMPGVFVEGATLIINKVREGSAKPVLIVPPLDGANAGTVAEAVCMVGMTADVPVLPRPAALTMKKLSESGFDRETVFSMKYVDKRTVTYNHTGSSSERGIEGAVKAAAGRCGVQMEKPDVNKFEGKIDFNYGRANSNFEKEKQYKVNPDKFGRSYGFPMQDHSKSADITMPYGIDRRGDDGTDLGIAWDMIDQNEVEKDIRCIPIRLMYAKLNEANPELKPCGDSWHMSKYLNTASGTFIYTLLSGRCPVDNRPEAGNADAMNHWLGQRIGYETAWRMSHIAARVPGFVVRSIGPADLAPNATSALEIKFLYPPNADVAVAVETDQPQTASVEPKQLTFTAQNYAEPQKVTIKTLKTEAATPFRIRLTTGSSDPVFNRLQDTWPYTATVQ